MRFALPATITTVVIVTIAMGGLFLRNQHSATPTAQLPEPIDFNKFEASNKPRTNNYKEYVDTVMHKRAGTSNTIHKSNFMNAWQNNVEHATSAQIAELPTEDEKQKDTAKEGTQTLSAGALLDLMNKQLNKLGEGAVQGDTTLEDIQKILDTNIPDDQTDAEQALTPKQQALHDYGNILATKIIDFREQHTDQLSLLDTFLKNRGDNSAKQSVVDLADAYSTLAQDVSQIDAPSDVQEIQNKTKQALLDIADGLKSLSTATTDNDAIAKMQHSNKQSAKLARATLSLIDFFTLNDITFTEDEPGHIFMPIRM